MKFFRRAAKTAGGLGLVFVGGFVLGRAERHAERAARVLDDAERVKALARYFMHVGYTMTGVQPQGAGPPHDPFDDLSNDREGDPIH